MIELSNIPYTHFAEAVKTLEYATDKTRNDLHAVHFLVRDGVLTANATDGIVFVSQHLQCRAKEDIASFGVDASILKQAVDALKSSSKFDRVELLTDGERLIVRPEQDEALAFYCQIASRWDRYLFLMTPRPADVTMQVDAKDLVAALRTCDRDSVKLRFGRATAGASSWTEISYRDDAKDWHEIISLPSHATDNLPGEVEWLTMHIQRKLLMNTLRRVGKHATLEMIAGWPVREGGVRVVGENGSAHTICTMKF